MDSSLPVAVLRFQLHNPGRKSVKASVCGSIPAFMVADDSGKQPPPYINRNISRDNGKVRGVFMQPKGGNQKAECYGTVTLATTEVKNIYTGSRGGTGCGARHCWISGMTFPSPVGMLYENQVKNGLRCASDVRACYDGKKT